MAINLSPNSLQLIGTKDERKDDVMRLNGVPIHVPKSILITGANRGIGLGLVKQFLQYSKVEHIFATARNPTASMKLRSIDDPRVFVLDCDVTDDNSLLNAYNQVEQVVGNDGLNLLVNNAGTYLPYEVSERPDRKRLLKQLDVNATSPLLVAQVFLPLLRRAAAIGGPMSIGRAGIVNISSLSGSVSMNNYGSSFLGNKGIIPYAMSKSAVNQLTRALAADLLPDGVLVVSMMPGIVKTSIGGPSALLTVDESCSQVVSTLLKLQQNHAGAFVSYQGLNMDF